ncbi:hypothetical protein BGZ58_010086 [Dissophora ornata]|nr:hypothetical protein BGZ58_010086 [Dissophora ornata]
MLSAFQSKPANAEPQPGPEPESADPNMPETQTLVETQPAPELHAEEHEDDAPPPPEPIRWFHAVDAPLTKPNEPKGNAKTPVLPKKPPTTWVPFSIRDSNALERAYQLTQPLREEKKQESGVSPETATEDNSQQTFGSPQEPPARLRMPSLKRPNTMSSSSHLSWNAPTSVLVNEDHLFEVDIVKMEIKPVYWLGATYEVRRAVWFLQLEGKFVPCEANLSQQIEYGYNKHQPWIVVPVNLDASGKEVIEEKQEKSWALLGKYISQYVIFSDAHHALLLRDDRTSKLAKSLLNLGGAHLIRGYDEVEKFISNKASEDAAQKKKDSMDTKKKETSEIQKKKEVAQTLKQKTKRLTEEEKDTIQESHEIEDYSNEEESEERVIDHLVLVIHGVGQKLGDRMEAINFIHDVNVMRRTMKETASTFFQQSPGNAAPKEQQGGVDKDKEAASRTAASKNPYATTSGFGVQLLPVEWRRQITFGMAAEDEELQRDLSTPEAEESCPTMEDIMLDGVPTIRMLVSDVLMDVLLYMTPNYKRKMMEVVTAELNGVYRKFIQHNPDFLRRGGKVSILGHSLGSLLTLDILNHQPFTPTQYQPIPSSPVYEKFISFDQGSINPVSLDFPVENFFALGSPIGLFLLLKGCKLGARLSDATLIPYHKGGLKGLHIGIQDFGNDIASRANTMLESVKLGITTSVFTRALGFRTNPISNAAVIQSGKFQESGSPSSNDTEMTSIGDGSDAAEGTSPNSSGNATPKLTSEMFSMISKAKVKALNKTGRVDWCLQEGVFENAYLSALSVHMQYWSDSDVAAFIIRQTYDMDTRA